MKKNRVFTGLRLSPALKKIEKVMRITLILTLVFSFQLMASNTNAQKEKISLNLKQATIEKVFDEIEKQTDYVFLFSKEMIDLNKITGISVQNKNIMEVLDILFSNSNINYRIIDNKIILTTNQAPVSRQQNKSLTIKGKVVDETGEPIPGVNVYIKGTNEGTITNIDGIYEITVNDENAVLVYSFIGYKNQEINIVGRKEINITMLPEVSGLEEVIVTGYGTQKKKLTTGANLNIKGDVITKLTPSNSIEALQGISPGVSITRSNGQPGSPSKVYIRGIGTIGNASPLYIVDGVTVGNIDYLSPADIESIDVLKDAASAAIYGARAANGVILVTTKKGKKGNLKVSFDGYMGWQNIYKLPDLLNAQEYAEIQNEGRINEGLLPYDYASLVPDWDKIESGQWQGTNWFKEIMNENALIQNYSINMNGGSDRSVYSFGAAYLDDQGVLGKQAKSRYKRLNLRLNSEHIVWQKNDLKIIKFGENLTYTNTDKPGIRTGNLYWSDVRNMLTASPFLPVYNDEGDYHYAIDWNPREGNPIALMEYLGKDVWHNNNSIVGNAYLELQPVKDLVVRSSFGFNTWFGSYRHWTPQYDLSANTQNPRDKVDQSMSQGFNYTFTNTVSYNKRLNDTHNFTVLVGTEMYKVTQSLSVSGHNEDGIFQDAEHAYLSNYPIVDPAFTSVKGADWYGSSILSYFGRFSYNYKEKYMLTAVLRADGSSNFAEGNRWGTFPSVSAGWVITNESFMEGNEWLNFLKLRGSWGQNGNQAIGAFQYSSSITYNNASYFYGPDKTIEYLGGYPARVPNPDVTWETSEQTDIGLDAHFMNSKLQLTFDWYKKDTRDWLVNPPTLATNGTASTDINGGRVTNKGVELSLGWRDMSSTFKYGVTVTMAYNHNEVTEIANDEKIIHGQANVLTHGISEIYRAEVGFPIAYFWGFKTDGIIQNQEEADEYNSRITSDPRATTPSPGDFRYVDQNGDGIIDDQDKIMLGDPNPNYNFGLQLFAEYKGFYLNMTGTGQAGMQVAKSYRSWNTQYGNYTTDVFQRWHGEGTSNTYPKVSSSANNNMLQMSDFFVEDADFFRISNITIGYNLDRFKFWPLAETKFYVTAKNLYTFTGYSGMDPEVGYGPDNWSSGIDLGLYPLSRSILIGLSVKF